MKSRIVRSLALAALAATPSLASAQLTKTAIGFTDGTAIPLELRSSLDSAKARPGDPVVARTVQPVQSKTGQLPRGAEVLGHVVTAQRYREGGLDRQGSQDALLVIQFDRIKTGGSAVEIHLIVRAVASSYEARDTLYASKTMMNATPYVRDLIGGQQVMPGTKYIYSPEGNKVALQTKDGIVGRLLAADEDSRSVTCNSTKTAQALGVFSTNACGAYGLDEVQMSRPSAPFGAIQLSSTHHDVALFPGSAVLLQVSAGGNANEAAPPNLFRVQEPKRTNSGV